MIFVFFVYAAAALLLLFSFSKLSFFKKEKIHARWREGGEEGNAFVVANPASLRSPPSPPFPLTVSDTSFFPI